MIQKMSSAPPTVAETTNDEGKWVKKFMIEGVLVAMAG